MSLFNITSIIFLLIFSQSVLSIEDIPLPPSLEKTPVKNTNTKAIKPPPPLPEEADDSRNIPQPEVRIIRNKTSVIEEYRVNGQLRYVKITPNGGVPYYMVDADGDGVLETRENDLDNPAINRWILMQW